MATQTWTLDTAGLKYIDKNKLEHTISTNETLTLTMTDLGTTATFQGVVGGGKVTCTDKFEFEPCADPTYWFLAIDGTSNPGGELAFTEEGNVKHVFRVISLNITDADGTGANNVVSITFESKDHAGKMTWTNINTA